MIVMIHIMLIMIEQLVWKMSDSEICSFMKTTCLKLCMYAVFVTVCNRLNMTKNTAKIVKTCVYILVQ